MPINTEPQLRIRMYIYIKPLHEIGQYWLTNSKLKHDCVLVFFYIIIQYNCNINCYITCLYVNINWRGLYSYIILMLKRLEAVNDCIWWRRLYWMKRDKRIIIMEHGKTRERKRLEAVNDCVWWRRLYWMKWDKRIIIMEHGKTRERKRIEAVNDCVLWRRVYWI